MSAVSIHFGLVFDDIDVVIEPRAHQVPPGQHRKASLDAAVANFSAMIPTETIFDLANEGRRRQARGSLCGASHEGAKPDAPQQVRIRTMNAERCAISISSCSSSSRQQEHEPAARRLSPDRTEGDARDPPCVDPDLREHSIKRPGTIISVSRVGGRASWRFKQHGEVTRDEILCGAHALGGSKEPTHRRAFCGAGRETSFR